MTAPASNHSGSADANTLPTHHAEDLTSGGTLAQIILGPSTYTLRITRAGKLILTK
ncbi:hemin uptake protein HemP [Pseudoruegeria sp. SK021]|uniref:hemin uptake protein HemP n=1 Tax=Pseudoruegeria sp. SK021 TaxID=1933035 RepID=UPI000A22B7FE|nr:hemin uptake protein HemP [Pseudoruegeria sp. SK021]OSP56023.1 hypothetical protein BV911_04585 [Pseudoruegeria sp. SK021]